jgi:hypothetical protein
LGVVTPEIAFTTTFAAPAPEPGTWIFLLIGFGGTCATGVRPAAG